MNPIALVGVFAGACLRFDHECGWSHVICTSQFGNQRCHGRKNEPDYARCVEISTRGAQREMLLPSILAIVVPIVIGVVFGVAGVMGLLIGGLSSGFVLAIFMANAGGAWDNAKKYIEEGNLGGKGSENHKATVVGDTVGDPFKDTSGPSLNILIKLMSMVSRWLAVLWSFCVENR